MTRPPADPPGPGADPAPLDAVGDGPGIPARPGLADALRAGPAARSGQIGPGLYLVATPIGAARDVTLRALDLIGAADLLLAEDTRTLRHLMDIHGVPLRGRRLWAYHDHNGAAVRPQVLAALAEGAAVVLVSEAGTPLLADPGYRLVRAAIAAGHAVTAAPGASALLAALSVAGLPTDRFAFLGFPPPAGAERRRFLAKAAGLEMTTVIYEAPHRIHRLLEEICETDPQRPVALCRELTKRFEEVIRGTAAEVAQQIGGRRMRGEFVLVSGAAAPTDPAEGLDAALAAALAVEGLRAAVDRIAAETGLPRRQVYRRALELRGEPEAEGDA